MTLTPKIYNRKQSKLTLNKKKNIINNENRRRGTNLYDKSILPMFMNKNVEKLRQYFGGIWIWCWERLSNTIILKMTFRSLCAKNK